MQKELRKRISEGTKTITFEQLSFFIGIGGASKSNHKQQPSASSENGLCVIPLEVPSLPDKFHPREGPLKALIASLVEHQTATVSLSSPKARNAIASQGMGGKTRLNCVGYSPGSEVCVFSKGCGKTTLTVAAVRDPVVRKHFECIAWQAVSQTPNISEIQSKLYMQLFENKLSDDAATDVGLAFKKLRQGSQGHTFLVVLDDVRFS